MSIVSALETTRLRLLPHAPEHLRALIAGYDEYANAFGYRAEPPLRDFYFAGEVSPAWLEQLMAATTADVWVHGFAVVLRATDSVIGTAAFKGAPDNDGAVEIAYGIVPAYRSCGYATEAAAALVAFAKQDSRTRVIRAHTLPDANASTRVLTKCGFVRIGDVVDPEDGPVWRWERR
jgi:RimJ/RimL family protein N-acetyltransferase